MHACLICIASFCGLDMGIKSLAKGFCCGEDVTRLPPAYVCAMTCCRVAEDDSSECIDCSWLFRSGAGGGVTTLPSSCCQAVAGQYASCSGKISNKSLLLCEVIPQLAQAERITVYCSTSTYSTQVVRCRTRHQHINLSLSK